MVEVHLELDDVVAGKLKKLKAQLPIAATEAIVLELYRRGELSSGKAAELSGMSRFEFVKYASNLGIPFFDMSEDEFAGELERTKVACRPRV